MRALVLRHDPGSVPGLLGQALDDRGVELEMLQMGSSIHDGTFTEPFPDLARFDVLLVMGAIYSLNDESQVGTWVGRELDLLRRADELGLPVIGVCFGAQALAAAHGGKVFRAGTPEIGFGEIDTFDTERLPAGPWMQWHYDTFTVPDGAELLAVTDVGPQAFVLRRNLAMQFHPEVDPAMLEHWVSLDPDGAASSVAEAGTDLDALRADAEANADRQRADIERILDWWLPHVGLVTTSTS